MGAVDACLAQRVTPTHLHACTHTHTRTSAHTRTHTLSLPVLPRLSALALAGVFGSPDMFINEYRSLLASQLLHRNDYDTVGSPWDDWQATPISCRAGCFPPAV